MRADQPSQVSLRQRRVPNLKRRSRAAEKLQRVQDDSTPCSQLALGHDKQLLYLTALSWLL